MSGVGLFIGERCRCQLMRHQISFSIDDDGREDVLFAWQLPTSEAESRSDEFAPGARMQCYNG